MRHRRRLDRRRSAEHRAREGTRENTEGADATEHQHSADKPTARRDRRVIAVADGRDRRECPPQRVTSRANVGAIDAFELEHGNRPGHQQHRAREGCGEQGVLTRSLAESLPEFARQHQQSNDAQNAQDARESCQPEQVHGRDAAQEVEPTGPDEIAPSLRGLREPSHEVQKEETAQCGIDPRHQPRRLRADGYEILHEKQGNGQQRKAEHEELVASMITGSAGRWRHRVFRSSRLDLWPHAHRRLRSTASTDGCAPRPLV